MWLSWRLSWHLNCTLDISRGVLEEKSWREEGVSGRLEELWRLLADSNGCRVTAPEERRDGSLQNQSQHQLHMYAKTLFNFQEMFTALFTNPVDILQIMYLAC